MGMEMWLVAANGLGMWEMCKPRDMDKAMSSCMGFGHVIWVEM